MATKEEVKRYLSFWFQLGKRVVIGNEGTSLLPQPIFQGDRYSQEFEECWQKVLLPSSGDCYVEGTDETIAALLTPVWEISSCGRCTMPVPMRNLGMPPESCPCSTLPSWPDTELPVPRHPVSNQEQLRVIRDRLLQNLTTIKQ